MGRALLEFEQLLNKPDSVCEKKPVFIAGLARAGTTILMRALYETGEFRSLTYRDMPFVLMPNTWARLSKPFRVDKIASERAHGDRIAIDYDSPEAFEEVFWRAHCGKDYILEDRLVPHSIDEETARLMRKYVDLVVSSADQPGSLRYLSKNNNNLLRLAEIKTMFPHAVLLIPFRDPLQQAVSLLDQHRRFTTTHRQDSFAQHYMNWLGHHEFGLNHKPFEFDPQQQGRLRCGNGDDIHYWLKYWFDVYEHVVSIMPDDSHLVCYEDLCASPEIRLQSVFTLCDVETGAKSASTRLLAAERRQVRITDHSLLERSNSLYESMRSSAVKSLANKGE